eukprot:gene4306-784_t
MRRGAPTLGAIIVLGVFGVLQVAVQSIRPFPAAVRTPVLPEGGLAPPVSPGRLDGPPALPEPPSNSWGGPVSGREPASPAVPPPAPVPAFEVRSGEDPDPNQSLPNIQVVHGLTSAHIEANQFRQDCATRQLIVAHLPKWGLFHHFQFLHDYLAWALLHNRTLLVHHWTDGVTYNGLMHPDPML